MAQGKPWEKYSGSPVSVSPAQSGGAVVLPPAPPPPPPPPPSRTPAGAATEGAPKGFAWVDPNNPSAGVYPIGGLPAEAREGARPEQEPLTSKARVDAEQAYTDAQTLYDTAQRLKVLYAQGPGTTKGIAGIQDFFPTASNRVFNDVGQQSRGPVKRAMGFTGGEGNVLAESEALYGPFLPKAGDSDAQILNKIAALEDLAVRSANMSSNLLNRPLPEFAGGPPAAEQPQGSAMDVLRIGGDQGGGTAAPRADVGSGQTINESYPEAMVREHDAIVARLVQEGGGRLDPNAYAAETGQLFQQYGYQRDPQEAAGWASSVNQYIDAGGRTIPSGIQPAERLMTARETMMNNLVNNPATAAGIGASNALAFGVPEMIAPDEFGALRDAQGVPMMLGEAGGAIAGTAALGGIGRFGASRLAPSLLQGGGRGQFARNVGTDALYGGIYGGTTQGDPLTGAALGTGGSVVGQGVGRAIGAGVGGVQISDAARILRERGVPISVGRQVGLGGMEDIAQTLPFAGSASTARQADSFVGFDEEAFRIAAQPAASLTRPVAVNMTEVGRGGIDALKKVEKQAYANALGGVNAPIDQQFFQDFPKVAQQIAGLPDDYRRAAQEVIQKRIAPAINNNVLSGKAFQQAIRGLRSAKSKAQNVGTTGFEDDYIAALNSAEDALTGVIQRGAGQDVIDDLARANEIYSNRKILENASLDRAKVGTRSGEVNVFTPSQLLESTRVAERRYGTGEELRKLGALGQQALPSTVPNSGTADRLIAMGALGTGVGAAGAGLGYSASDNPQMAGQEAVGGSGMGLGGLLGAGALGGLLGTRRGQQAIETLLITRPQAAQAFGQGVRRRAGIFGSAALPTFVQMNQPQPIYVPQ